MFYMRIVIIAVLFLIMLVPARAETDGSFTSGLSKVELVQELAVSGMRKLLGWSGGNAYFAKKDGSVSVMSKDGKELFTLQAKINKDEAILKQPEAVAVMEGMIYVVDSKTDRVAMFNLQGKYQGSLGTKSDGGFFSGKGNSLSSPHGIAAHDGVLYVAVKDQGLAMFDTAAKRWREVDSKFKPRSCQMTAYRGEIWMMGGRDTAGEDQTLIYSPHTGAWRQGPLLPRPLSWGAAEVINGRLIMTGGAASYGGDYLYNDRTFVLRQR